MRLRPPQTNYASVEEIGKFNMIWNVSLALVPIFLFLFGLHVYFKDVNWTTSFAAFSLAAFNLLVLWKTRKYFWVAVWSVVLSAVICQISIFVVADSHVVTDTMWCIMSAFFAYFIFGWIVGSIVLLANLSGLLLFLFMVGDGEIIAKGLNPQAVDSRLVINVYYVAIALAFVIYKMLENNLEINRRYSEQIDRNEVLMKEIHHRVKNNLQIISSLLRLQSIETDDAEVKEQFEEAIGRIRSMALIHEKMYHDDDMSQIDLPAYLKSLSNDIVQSQETHLQLKFEVLSELNRVDIKNIVPISLIFNELITNSLKHGFTDFSSAVLRLEIALEDYGVVFRYSDNGEWKAPKSTNSFGLELVETLSEQMEGTCVREINNGTHYTLTFDKDQFFFKA